jgi:protein required for attachment to host cells
MRLILITATAAGWPDARAIKEAQVTQDMTTWIVTADGRHASAYEERRRNGNLHPVPGYPLEAGSVGESHRHRATVHGRAGDARHGAGERDPAEMMEQRFLAEVADKLETAAAAGRFERLVLMAPPHALGILRNALGPKAASRVELSEAHDRSKLSGDALREALRKARGPH